MDEWSPNRIHKVRWSEGEGKLHPPPHPSLPASQPAAHSLCVREQKEDFLSYCVLSFKGRWIKQKGGTNETLILTKISVESVESSFYHTWCHLGKRCSHSHVIAPHHSPPSMPIYQFKEAGGGGGGLCIKLFFTWLEKDWQDGGRREHLLLIRGLFSGQFLTSSATFGYHHHQHTWELIE